MTFKARTSLLSLILGASCSALVVGACGGGDDATLALGDACDAEADEPGCSEDAECTAGTETGASSSEESAEDARCLLKEGSLCDLEAEEGFCGPDLTCAPTTDDEARCFGRVVLRGQVSDTSDSSAIEGAQIIGLNDQGAAVTDVVTSNADGAYLLDLPVVRNADGSPAAALFTLRAAAHDYLPFPEGIRVALPIQVEDAEREGKLYVVSSALTDVGLVPLPAGERYSASGRVTGLDEDSKVGGLLIVATGEAGTFLALTDRAGNYTLFNLPPGDYEVAAFAAGVQVQRETVTISDANVEGVDLTELDEVTTTVTGSVQIVNAPGGAVTSVILVPEATFSETTARGEIPLGLRAGNVSGEFEIEGVPAGDYVVLAAYENDDLVRDPDTNIAGTGFVHITIAAGTATYRVEESFKVTEALGTISPGKDAAELVTEKPLLEWADDSSEEWYDLHVFNALGEEVWSSLEIPGASGGDPVSVQYEGPLDPGMYYQFRVVSWRAPGGDPAPISSTEDLRGVFFTEAE